MAGITYNKNDDLVAANTNQNLWTSSSNLLRCSFKKPLKHWQTCGIKAWRLQPCSHISSCWRHDERLSRSFVRKNIKEGERKAWVTTCNRLARQVADHCTRRKDWRAAPPPPPPTNPPPDTTSIWSQSTARTFCPSFSCSLSLFPCPAGISKPRSPRRIFKTSNPLSPSLLCCPFTLHPELKPFVHLLVVLLDDDKAVQPQSLKSRQVLPSPNQKHTHTQEPAPETKTHQKRITRKKKQNKKSLTRRERKSCDATPFPQKKDTDDEKEVEWQWKLMTKEKHAMQMRDGVESAKNLPERRRQGQQKQP